MSDIVIRGMKKPKSCGECPAIKSPAGFTGNTYYDGCSLDESLEVMAEERHENCPLVELQPHGRLGDLDKLASKVAEAQEQMRGKDYDPFMLLGDVLRWIGLTPTVLEATE